MNTYSKTITGKVRTGLLAVLLFFVCGQLYSQTTGIQGIVRDSLSGEPIPYATIRFDGSTIGGLSGEDGSFSFSNKLGKTTVVISMMGYNTKTISIPLGKHSIQDILLKGEGIQLNELVVRKTKEEYSRKNNPAVILIEKVIERKHNYTIRNQDFYKNEEYDRLFFGLNEFDASKGQFKQMSFLTKYIDTSRIDSKAILPFSVRETLSNTYYRKNPKDTKRIIKAHKTEGLDQGMNLESLDGVLKEIFKNIDITDNSIDLLFHEFVGPLNSNISTSFYKWYIIDTVKIDNKQYTNLGFVPFNTRDVGFSGNIYISTDSTYAVKRVVMRVPTNINLNFVEEMLIKQDFEELSPNLWIPTEFVTAIDLSVYDAVKLYVEKVKSFHNFTFTEAINSVFINPAPEIFIDGYDKHKKEYWDEMRPAALSKDYQVKEMMDELMANKLINIAVTTANIISSGYVATSKDEDKNKVDIGNVLTFYSNNKLEGNRFRLTAASTSNFHKHLFLYGYVAYGTRDEKFKYMGEVNWAFNKPKYHKNEFPVNNLALSYQYDVKALGQTFTQAERDNIFLSSTSSNSIKLIYNRMAQLSYNKEYHKGFAFSVFARAVNEKPTGDLLFERQDELGNLYELDNLRTTEVGFTLRYAPQEKFYQQRRTRRSLPSRGIILSLSHTIGLKNALGADYGYQKTVLSATKEIWIAPFGKIYTSAQAEKVWGEAPFPRLATPNANTSFTIQRGTFYLLEPLEFINDAQASWDINYRMGGWLLNRVPLIKIFKLREIIGFRGFWGQLSNKNNPEFNHNMLIFPRDVYTIEKHPYMEMNIGVDNIFKFLRIDYVRRLNYLDHADINKDGIRISFELTF